MGGEDGELLADVSGTAVRAVGLRAVADELLEVQQRRELALRLESAQEEERRRIAADIHDDPIQVMSAVDLRMGMMVERDEPVDPALIATLQETVRQSIERLRSLLFELRPAALDRDGLVAAQTQ